MTPERNQSPSDRPHCPELSCSGTRGRHALPLTVLLTAGLLAAFGRLPWRTLALRFGDTLFPQAGQLVQIAVTGLLLALAFFFPASRRALAHGASHRDSSLRMEDIARAVLTRRQEGAERPQTRIVEALHACRDIRKWRQQVELEECVVASHLSQLQDQLDATLPELGLKTVPTGENVVSIPQKPAAE